MEKVGKAIVKLRIPILILSVLLLIPAGIGYVKTKVNYDILYYLPGDIDTMKGQDILMDEFNKGALNHSRVLSGVRYSEISMGSPSAHRCSRS